MRHALLIAATLLALTSSARASSLTYTITFDFMDHATEFYEYPQFDPAPGPLTEVLIQINGTASSPGIGFENLTESPQTFTGTYGIVVEPFDQASFTKTITTTLPPDGSIGGLGDGGTFSISYAQTTYLDYFVGTGYLHPDVGGGGIVYFSDNPAVKGFRGPDSYVVAGTETVTYIFGLPEPPGVVLLVLGLAGAGAGAALGRRRATPAGGR